MCSYSLDDRTEPGIMESYFLKHYWACAILFSSCKLPNVKLDIEKLQGNLIKERERGGRRKLKVPSF